MKQLSTLILVQSLFFQCVFAQSTDLLAPRSDDFRRIERTAHSEQNTFSSRAIGDTIWYDDLSDASDWVLINDQNYQWEFTSNLDTNLTGQGFDSTLNSATPNQFAIIDADVHGNVGSTQTCYLQMANPINLSAFTSVELQWTQYHRHWYDPHYVEVSTDGMDWTAFEVNFGGNGATRANAEHKRLNISSIAAEQVQVYVRFRYEGYFGWFWCIDDVAIVEGATFDVTLTDAYHMDKQNVTGYSYSRIPLNNVYNLAGNGGSAWVTNSGASPVNPIIEWQVISPSGIVASGSGVNNGDFSFSNHDTVGFTVAYDPTELGVHTLECNATLPGTIVDEFPSDNIRSSSFVVTEHVWGHDDESSWEVIGDYSQYGARDFGSIIQPQSPTNDYGTIYGIQVAFAPGNPENATYSAKVYFIDGQTGDYNLVSETLWNLTNDVVEGEYTTIPLDNPVTMGSDGSYVIMMGAEDGVDMNVYWNTTNSIKLDYSNRLYVYDTDTWYYTTNTPAIRAYLNCIAPSSNTTHYTCDDYLWNGQTYTESGVYSYQTETSSGCDSIAYLDLNIVPMIPAQIDDYLCNNEPVTINNVTYSQVGTYTQVLAGANGCDTLLSINLTQGVEPNIYQSEVICGSESVLINGISYNQAGNYTQTFPGVNGCDTILNISLTENPDPQAVILGNVAITPSSVYTYGFVNPGGYSVTWGAVNGIILDGQGTNTVSIFWDASGGGEVVLTLSNGTCTFDYYLSVGNFVSIRELAESDVRIYPNPVENELRINLENLFGHAEVSLLDSQGRMVYKNPVTANMSATTARIDMSAYPIGFYMLLIEADNGSIVKKFVKDQDRNK